MRKVNYRSDFDFVLRLFDCRGVEVGFPEYDWVARFWTGVKANAYEVSCIGGVRAGVVTMMGAGFMWWLTIIIFRRAC